jgi:NifU-like protein
MPVFPEEIASVIRSPRYGRAVEDPNAVGTDAKLDCGCFVRAEMRISEDARIEDVAFRSNGCGFMVAAAECLAESVDGRLLTELSGVTGASIEIPVDRQACERAVSNAFRYAFASYRQKLLDEFRGEKALICTCFGVAEETVESYVAAKRPASVEEVSIDLRAGSGCGSCRMLIQEIIDANV